MKSLVIAAETDADAPGVAEVVRAAFGGNAEAWLIDRLRDDGLIEIALVAKIDGETVGHIVFSRLEAEQNGAPISALALAPVAAAPRMQRSGIGSALIEAGLGEARRRGFDAVFVLGHPAYYPRFGFDPALAAPFASPFRGAAFMAIALRPDALTGAPGRVTYPPAFS